MNHTDGNEKVVYYGMNLLILIFMFGGIYVAGILTGVDWTEYIPHFSWDMVNTREIKQIIGLG